MHNAAQCSGLSWAVSDLLTETERAESSPGLLCRMILPGASTLGKTERPTGWGWPTLERSQ